ncbi:MAG: bifunctional (p)ppGpp synthetase/guanosine-3',5'-bis(diphosphate) 3'-pyrophosphohydrolase [Parcubacteria group bacterium]|nr:bifunctional (p)ppGpp synthetase/guanosine-3',5'-bis(diphosphate) 3'-pyrophosphohydrolase [Parcubacteria group bacterium]
MQEVNEILTLLPSASNRDKDLITRAYTFAQEIHKDQQRESGDPYSLHVFEVAKTLANFKMDAETIAAGLLHDVIEDSEVTEAELAKQFGDEVAFLIQGVTKLKKYQYKGLERYAESLRRFLLAVAEDPRVLIIKFADRLHNLQTLKYVKENKQKRVAVETLEIYGPIANRLGMGRIKGALEDLAFPYAHPDAHKETLVLLKQKSKENLSHLEKVYRSLQKELYKEGIKPVEVDYRVKHLYSLYKKLQRYDMDIDKVYDIAALRIVVDSVADCYRVLGIIHGAWRPLPGRIKDYIAAPKLNGYQSIHTTIFTGDGGIVEIQIRTTQMHKEAEYGIASHLAYKEIGKGKTRGERDFKKKLEWIREISEWQKHVAETGEFLERLKKDFFSDRVFVFTPDGDVIDLPQDSTPIDFAYAIHSDIGDHTSAARVNARMVSLDTPLHNGDIVEIVTKKSSMPSHKWLGYIKTGLARKHIKAALTKK